VLQEHQTQALALLLLLPLQVLVRQLRAANRLYQQQQQRQQQQQPLLTKLHQQRGVTQRQLSLALLVLLQQQLQMALPVQT
jgi:hypothetical protein